MSNELPHIEFQQIGVIHSPFTALENMPIQPCGAPDAEGRVVVDPRFVEGLSDLEGFSHIYLLYEFHQAGAKKLTVTPFLDPHPRGVFATRAPVRPNPVGLSVVELLSVDGNVLTVRGIDILDGTPLLDVKPYVEKFDHPAHVRSGWMQAAAETIEQQRSDDRFKDPSPQNE